MASAWFSISYFTPSSPLESFQEDQLEFVALFQFEKSSRLSREAEDQLKVIPKFCFPDSQDWKPTAHMPRSDPAGTF